MKNKPINAKIKHHRFARKVGSTIQRASERFVESCMNTETKPSKLRRVLNRLANIKNGLNRENRKTWGSKHGTASGRIEIRRVRAYKARNYLRMIRKNPQ